MVPKKDGSWRMVSHLSAPEDHSVNDGISWEEVTLRYPSVDTAVAILHQFEPGAYMVKVDLQHAFRQCPVHPSDWPLLGCYWNWRYYVHRRLPFGLRSAPSLFNQIAEVTLWILQNRRGVRHILHYLDDFLAVAGSKEEAQRILRTVLELLEVLGVGRVVAHQSGGPSSGNNLLGYRNRLT